MLLASASFCDIPEFVNYQGILTDSGGMPLDGTYDLRFEIFDALSAGVVLYGQTNSSETVDDGLFNVILGPIDGAIFEDGSLWVQVTVDGDIIAPRTQLTSVPWAYRSAVAETALTVSTIPSHDHDARYYTKTELNSPGIINDLSNPVDWTKLKNVPAGFADGTDDVGGPDADWTISGSDMYSAVAGDVGIGTSAPSVKLDVRGRLYVGAPGEGYNVIFHGYDPDGSGMWWLGSPLSLVTGIDTDGTHWSSVGSFSISSGYNNKIEGNSAACFGAWNSAPGTQTLTAGYHSTASGLRSVALGSYATTGGEESFAVGYSVAAMANNSMVMGSGLGGADTLKNNIPNSLLVGFDGAPMFFVGGPNERVGIGTTTPAQALDVVGTAEVDGFIMPTGATDGYVLTSDASGAGTWQATSAISDGDWTIFGSNMYSAVTGNVGIGTASPVRKLDVDGEINTSSSYAIDQTTVLSTDGSGNLHVGSHTGPTSTGAANTFVGETAGYSNTSGGSNTFVGYQAGNNSTTGTNNTFVGYAAGKENGPGAWNTFLGFGAGRDNYDDYNVFLGMNAGRYNTTGYSNTFVGTQCGINNDDGVNNVYVGRSTGYNNVSGSGNVFLGAYAGYNETGSEKLYIESGTSSSPLVYGEFDNDLVVVNGTLDVTSSSSTRTLDVYNSAFTSATQLVNFETDQSLALAADMLQIKCGALSDTSAQFIECERGGSDVEFKVNVSGRVFADGSFTGPADFSEMFEVSSGAISVEPGDVMTIDPSNPRAIVKSTGARSKLVAGIYSTKPGFVGSHRDWDKVDAASEEIGTYTMKDMANEFNEVPLAVMGVVPCKVSAENGEINPGDLLVTSGTPGHAMRDDDAKAGTIVGKALGSLRNGTGVIEVLVTLQ
jgi:hypothetical protein